MCTEAKDVGAEIRKAADTHKLYIQYTGTKRTRSFSGSKAGASCCVAREKHALLQYV